MRNGFKFLQHVKSKTGQFEIVFKSLAHLNAQLRLQESFKLNVYLLYKLRTFGDKSRNSLVTKTTLNFSGPCRRVLLAKLTNHSVRTNLESAIKLLTIAFLSRGCL